MRLDWSLFRFFLFTHSRSCSSFLFSSFVSSFAGGCVLSVWNLESISLFQHAYIFIWADRRLRSNVFSLPMIFYTIYIYVHCKVQCYLHMNIFFSLLCKSCILSLCAARARERTDKICRSAIALCSFAWRILQLFELMARSLNDYQPFPAHAKYTAAIYIDNNQKLIDLCFQIV